MLVIKHKRDECIGCNACVEQAPSHFVMAQDGLVRLSLLEKSVDRNDVILEFSSAPEEDEDELMTAADLCPTRTISIHRKGQGGY